MTRETKIGLLIGLGFIVVFAVLLSNSGQLPPPGDSIDLVSADRGDKVESSVPGPVGSTTVFPDVVADGRARGGLSTPAGDKAPAASQTASAWDGTLPRPSVLDPDPGEHTRLASGSVPGAPGPTAGGTFVEVLHRVAPPLTEPVEEPQATPRPGLPSTSPEPAPAPEVAPAPRAPEPIEARPSREYLVQKGDTLGKIAKQFYDTAAVAVVEYLAKSNKDRIKDKHSIAEGQKLLIPNLPPGLVEPADNFAPAKFHAAVPLDRGDTLANLVKVTTQDPPRRAPTAVLPLTDTQATKATGPSAAPAEKQTRWYVVKQGETLSSIARKELGSSGRWREIQNLNKGLDPTKMKSGDKLKLPARQPVSAAETTGQSSA